MGCNSFVYLSVFNEGTTEPTGEHPSFTWRCPGRPLEALPPHQTQPQLPGTEPWSPVQDPSPGGGSGQMLLESKSTIGSQT